MTVASTQTTAECPLCKSFSHRVHRHDKRTLQDVGLAHYRMTLQLQVPKVLGADDFVFRRGRQYGTILVDLEHHQPVALLADHKAETLADWLLHHPRVEVVSRDRSKIYHSGVNQGAPDALQVADRFHLVQNLTETLEKVFSHYPADVKAIEHQHRPKTTAPDGAIVRASMMTNISNGVVEELNDRLKMLKRQMYGRAGIALLNKRFILAS